MKKDKQYELSVIWRTMDPEKKIKFLDGTEQYFIPRIKLEKDTDGKYRMLDTAVDIYRPYEDFFVDYAYEHGIKALSDSLCYSYHFDRLDAIQKYEKDASEALIDRHKDALKGYDLKNILHINQIKLNYDNKQREDSKAIQKVRTDT